jgi:hypothetical protein
MNHGCIRLVSVTENSPNTTRQEYSSRFPEQKSTEASPTKGRDNSHMEDCAFWLSGSDRDVVGDGQHKSGGFLTNTEQPPPI